MEIPEPITVRCSAIVIRQDQVLLCHRADGFWVLPGGSPHRAEGAPGCAEREVSQETGLTIRPLGVAFVFDVTSPNGDQHGFEIVFDSEELDASRMPEGPEEGLVPSFVALDSLAELSLLPSISHEIRAFGGHVDRGRIAPYLGNLWIPVPGTDGH